MGGDSESSSDDSDGSDSGVQRDTDDEHHVMMRKIAAATTTPLESPAATNLGDPYARLISTKARSGALKSRRVAPVVWLMSLLVCPSTKIPQKTAPCLPPHGRPRHLG